MIVQLNPPVPVFVLDRGQGLAAFLIDYGPEHDLIWVTALDDGGEVWCAPNPKVRFLKNWSMGRTPGQATQAPAGEAGAA